MKNIIVKVRPFLLSTLITVLLLETFVRLIPEPKPFELFQMETSPELETNVWIKQWREDHERLRRNFRAYELYGLDPYPGKEIRIDSNGFRYTENKILPNEGTTRIGFFGGSTMWGSYCRDIHTIPSEVSALLSERHLKAYVANYGQVGFVFSQELHTALRVMYSDSADHPAPNEAVFLDGVNDVLAAINNYTQGISHPESLPWESQKYRYLFKLGNTGEIGIFDILKKFKFVRMASKVLERRGLIRGEPKGVWVKPEAEVLDRLALDVARQYLKLVQVAHGTLSGNGIRSTFILQPILAAKKHPTPSEAHLMEINRLWEPYLRKTYAHIRELAVSLPPDIQFVDLGDFFKDDTDLVFNDAIHYSELGNKKIAAFIASKLIREKFPARLSQNR